MKWKQWLSESSLEIWKFYFKSERLKFEKLIHSCKYVGGSDLIFLVDIYNSSDWNQSTNSFMYPIALFTVSAMMIYLECNAW